MALRTTYQESRHFPSGNTPVGAPSVLPPRYIDIGTEIGAFMATLVQIDVMLATWLLGLCATLIATGVAGLWQLSNSVAKLQVTVSNWSKIFEDRFVFITAKTDEHERRIGHLEARAAINRTLIDRLVPNNHRDEGTGE